MANSVLQIRIDDDLKNNAAEVFDSIGLDLSTAIRMFLNKSILLNGLPFDINNGEPKKNKTKNKIISNDYLDKFISREKPLYDNISVEKYLKESRSDR